MKNFFCVAYVVAACLVVGCSQQPAVEEGAETTQFAPPQVERGINLLYHPESGDKSDDYMAKTDPDKVDDWFNINDDGTWWIDWDAERAPLDLIVIHHSAGSPNADSAAIDKIHREGEYFRRYQSENNDPYVKGLRPLSGHVVDGRQRFIAYHHLVYANGEVTDELKPLVEIDDQWWIDMVGWHSNDWEVNCRSIAICLVGDFSDQVPPDEQIEAARQLIADYKTLVPNLTVEPHSHFSATECPGKTWDLWRDRIIN